MLTCFGNFFDHFPATKGISWAIVVTMKFSLSLLLLVVLAQDYLYGDWPRFRGPGGTGVVEGADIPTEITEKNIIWSAELPGNGVSSPVIVRGKIFVTAVLPEKKRAVLAIDLANGKELWRKEFSFVGYSQHRFNSFASATPTADENSVFIGWVDAGGMRVIALDHSGELRWTKKIDDEFQNQHGAAASPVLCDGVLVVTNEKDQDSASICGLDPANGEKLWQVNRKNGEGKSPFVTPNEMVADAGTLLVFSSSVEGVTAIEAKSGRIAWHFPHSFEARCVAGPVVADQLVFVCAGLGGGGKESIALSLASNQPELAWELDKRIPYVPTGLFYDRHIFLLKDNGMVSCIAAKTGEVLWDERVVRPAYSSPLCIDGHLYCIDREGDLAVLKAGPEFSLVSSFQFGEKIDATPAVADGKLIVRTEKRLMAIAR